jgi:hypothetical protein
MPDMSTFFQTPGVGGVIAAAVITSIIITYGLTLRWVIRGYEDDKDSK